MKLCIKCGIEKLENEFNKSSFTKTGLRSWCRDCEKKENNKYRLENLEEERRRKREWAKIPSGIYNAIKYGNKRKQLIISKKDFIDWYNNEPKICSYCGITLEDLDKINDTHNNKISRLSIDCINNSKGYELGNICLACLRCNYTKNDFFTYDEMKEIGMKYIKTKWTNQLEGD